MSGEELRWRGQGAWVPLGLVVLYSVMCVVEAWQGRFPPSTWVALVVAVGWVLLERRSWWQRKSIEFQRRSIEAQRRTIGLLRGEVSMWRGWAARRVVKGDDGVSGNPPTDG